MLVDNRRIARLPVHIAERVLELRAAGDERGEHDTVNELVALIEAVVSHLGRLWVAEYLHAGATDARLNRELFDRLGRNVLVGDWVWIGRRIRESFLEHGLTTVVYGLADQDFGSAEETDHPVARLVRYRNSYSHGSMGAVVEDIRVHRNLLAAVLARPILTEQPIRFRTGYDGTLLTATLDWEPAGDRAGEGEPLLHPFIVGQDGATVLRLYPLVYVVESEAGYALRHGSTRDATHPLTSLFEREMVRMWFERYQHEQQGHLEFESVIAERDVTPLPEEVLAEVAAALSEDDVSLVVVEAYPGCGKSGALAKLPALAPEGRYAGTSVFVVTSGDLGQSGVTFARYLLRRTERVLGREDGFFGNDPANLLNALEEANRMLQQARLRLLVGVEDFHFGCEAYRGEALTVADVYQSLAGGAIHIVATTHPGRIRERLIFDRKVVVPIPDAGRIGRHTLKQVVAELCPPEAPLRRRVMQQLVHLQTPLSLFALCEALEHTGLVVFEPAVERALWDLRPLLRVERSGRDKLWTPFTPVLAEPGLFAG